MKVVAITGERRCEIVDRPEPAVTVILSKIRIESAPMCTEVKQYIGGQSTECLGHEAAGTIVEAAAQSRFAAGTRVVAMPLYGCGSCELCVAGEHILCANPVEPAAGGSCYAQYLLKPDHLLLPIPDDIATDYGSMACCGLGPTFQAAQRLSICASDTVLIYGLGAVGLGGVINATANGARVIGVEPNEYRASLATQLGADCVITARDPGEV